MNDISKKNRIGRLKKGKQYQVKRRNKPGTPPGTLVPDPSAQLPTMHMIIYDENRIEEFQDCSLEQIRIAQNSTGIIWINVDGLGDIELIQQLGQVFGLHLLALEDVVNLHQRPKAEEYDDHVFIVTRMLLLELDINIEQVAMFLGNNLILTFQERHSDCFDTIRKRLKEKKGRIRSSGADFLAYTLLDAVIDNYFPALERLGDELEDCEDTVISHPNPEVIQRLHTLKRDLLTIRRAVWPQREMLNVLVRDETPFIHSQTHVYLRDCYDHVIQLMDIIETYREMTSGLLDIYLSSISNHMNEIMKVLTIIATIFIPLSFIAGLYGMNFDRATSPWNMPELSWRYGYPFALLIMLFTAGGLIYYFKRKGWLGRRVHTKGKMED